MLKLRINNEDVHSAKAKTLILQAEYIGLMKFIPNPATDAKIQICPLRRFLIG